MKYSSLRLNSFFIFLIGTCKIKKSLFRKRIIFVFTMAMFFIGSGCHSYFRVNSSSRPASGIISSLDNAGKTIVLHFENKKWILRDLNIEDSVLTGRIKEYDMQPTIKPVRVDRPNRYMTRALNSQVYLLNEVHLYVDEYSNLVDGKVSIPVESISRMDIYDKDTQSTVGSYILGGLGIAAGIYFGVGIIILLTKESCPFIYTWDGHDYHFAGEIYSGSIHKPLERNDYLKLPNYPGQITYSLKISNEVREIQNTNLLELVIVDHPGNMNVLADKYGKIHTLESLLPPSSASDIRGGDINELLSLKDSHFYQTYPDNEEIPERDGIILEFPGKAGAKSAKLAIRAKNSIILDYMMGQFHDLYGSKYKYYMHKQENADGDELRQWTLKQGLPLSVYVERAGNWEFADYFNIAGPMAFKEDILEIPLTGQEKDPVRVKLEFGSFLWEIDYAAIDYSPGKKVTYTTVPVTTAFNEKQKDVTGLLSSDDNQYYTQPEIGNQAIVTFALPELSGEDRTVILHSKGWYQVIRNPIGKPDIEKLKAFRQPGHFNRFVNEHMKSLGQLVLRPRPSD